MFLHVEHDREEPEKSATRRVKPRNGERKTVGCGKRGTMTTKTTMVVLCLA